MSNPMEESVGRMQQGALKATIGNTGLWDFAKSDFLSLPPTLVFEALGKLRDKELPARKNIMQKLLNVYHIYCDGILKGHLLEYLDHFEQIPASIIAFAVNHGTENSRPLDLEFLVSEKLFPHSLGAVDETYHWLKCLPYLSSCEKAALEHLLLEKRRFQEEVRNYLRIRESKKENLAEDMGEEISLSFLNMSTFFVDRSEAIKCLQTLHMLNDKIIFKYLSRLVHWITDSDTAKIFREYILKKIGDNNALHVFMERLLLKCSYSIFSCGHLQTILYVLDCEATNATFDSTHHIDLFCMIINGYPEMLSGWSKSLLDLLNTTKGSSRISLLETVIKLGNDLPIKSSNILPLLERINVEGSQVESNLAVLAMTSLTDDVHEAKRRKNSACLPTPELYFS